MHHARRAFDSVGRANEHIQRPERLLLQAKSLSDAALYAVTHGGGRSMLARDQDSEPRRARAAPFVIEEIACTAGPDSAAKQPLVVALAPEAPRCVQAEAFLCRRYNGYSPRRRRPRARRLRSTLRPPGVRLRTRNPWRRARRVFEG
jgi:hypothetical protein